MNENHGLKNYVVVIEKEHSASEFDFECQAKDDDHAREQVMDAYPRCNVICMFTYVYAFRY